MKIISYLPAFSAIFSTFSKAGQEERDRKNETVQDRQGRQDYQDQDWTAMTGNKKKDSQNRTARKGQPR